MRKFLVIAALGASLPAHAVTLDFTPIAVDVADTEAECPPGVDLSDDDDGAYVWRLTVSNLSSIRKILRPLNDPTLVIGEQCKHTTFGDGVIDCSFIDTFDPDEPDPVAFPPGFPQLGDPSHAFASPDIIIVTHDQRPDDATFFFPYPTIDVSPMVGDVTFDRHGWQLPFNDADPVDLLGVGVDPCDITEITIEIRGSGWALSHCDVDGGAKADWEMDPPDIDIAPRLVVDNGPEISCP